MFIRPILIAAALSLPAALPAGTVPGRAEGTAEEKEWTVMVFVNGKNDLEEFALKDMNEMEAIGSSGQVNVVAEIGRIAGYDYSDGDWTGSRRYLVEKDSDTGHITSPVLMDLDKADMGDYRHLVEFANWAKTSFPARKYMLVVWNHGSGWNKAGAVGRDRGISYDDETRHHISTPQLGLALREIGGVDVYGSDACLMQMPEVAYELSGNAGYILGSEEAEPGDGYPYDLLLAPLVKNPAMTPEELGRTAVKAYFSHYRSTGESSTLSLVKTAALPGYLSAVNDFVAAAIASNEKSLVSAAVADAQYFSAYNNKDLWHFLKLYAAGSNSAAVKIRAKALQDYLLDTLVIINRVTGDYGNARGLAVYMPNTDYEFSDDYRELAWARASQWDEFVNWYTQVK